MAITTALVKKLVQIPIFGGLTVVEAADFFEVALELSAPSGTVLFSEGEEGDALLVLLEGEVAVSLRGVELARVGKHAVLGEMTLVDGKSPRSATATVLEEVKLLKVPSRRVQKLVQQDNVAALKVVANLAQVMSRRLAAINDRLVESLGERGKGKAELANFSRILTQWDF